MSKKNLITGTIILLVVGVCLFLFVSQSVVFEVPHDEYSQWHPNAAYIQNEIGTEKSPNPKMSEEERREKFTSLFQSRFRRHKEQIAIRLDFETPTQLKMKTTARLEPFVINRIALAAWRESKACFGTHCDLDIYETFIGSKSRKIGELRAFQGDKNIAYITYQYPKDTVLRIDIRDFLPEGSVFQRPNRRGALRPIPQLTPQQ